MRKPRRSRTRPLRTDPYENPKYERGMRRSGRMPITLLDGSSRANIARDLATLAASWHGIRPCYALTIQRMAVQIEQSYTAAAAIAAMTSTPATNANLAEVTLSDPALVERTLGDYVSGPI